MKRCIAVFLCFALIISAFPVLAFADGEIKVTINGQNLTMDQPPVLVNDRTLVPVRAIFEALGATVSWNNDTNTATGVLGSTTVEIQIENTVAKVNGKDVTLDVPALLISDRTLVPVRFISESLGAKVSWDDANQTVIITTSANGFSLDFEDENLDSIDVGGNYQKSSLKISSDVFHSGSKSLCFGSRKANNDRLKLINAFGDEYKKETYNVSVWVYVPDKSVQLTLAGYGAKGTQYAFVPVKPQDFNVEANKWTELNMSFFLDNSEITQIGLDQRNTSGDIAETIYVDDISITSNASGQQQQTQTPAQIADSLANVTTSPVKDGKINGVNVRYANVSGRRPTPISDISGKGYDDLLFFDREIEKNGDKKSHKELYAALPEGKTLRDNSHLIESVADKNLFEICDVTDMPFDKSVKTTLKAVPEYVFSHQLVLPYIEEGAQKTGDPMMIEIYVKVHDVVSDTSMAKISVKVENETGNKHVIMQEISIPADNKWHKYYYSFKADAECFRPTIRFGYCVQTVEVGGYRIANYAESGLTIDDIPTMADVVEADLSSLFDKDAQWRKDAWDRIEKIRKGDINIIVKDKNGNPVKDADVSVNMYEHEFNWGTAVNEAIYGTKSVNDSYRNGLRSMFNSAVIENELKWTIYEDAPEKAQAIIKVLKNLGINTIKGHSIMYDRFWYEGASCPPADIPLIMDDRKKLDKRCEEHIKGIISDFDEEVNVWDGLNEALSSRMLIGKWGNEIIKQWFDWMKEEAPDKEFYFSDNGINGGPTTNTVEKYGALLGWMKNNGVKFDGISIQGHTSLPYSVEDFYNQLVALSKYSDKFQIGEFDLSKIIANDAEVESSYMRDLLIMFFSFEPMNSVYTWGFYSGVHYDKNAPIYYSDWTLRPSGKQFVDLVYNKWWTEESGKTDGNGIFSTRGYYGDYDITVTSNGQTKTVSAACRKGNDNTITITLD